MVLQKKRNVIQVIIDLNNQYGYDDKTFKYDNNECSLENNDNNNNNNNDNLGRDDETEVTVAQGQECLWYSKLSTRSTLTNQVCDIINIIYYYFYYYYYYYCYNYCYCYYS